MSETELITAVCQHTEAARENAAEVRERFGVTGRLDMKMTGDLLMALRDATCAAQELDNRARGMKPRAGGD
jgi:hypothetical protein